MKTKFSFSLLLSLFFVASACQETDSPATIEPSVLTYEEQIQAMRDMYLDMFAQIEQNYDQHIKTDSGRIFFNLSGIMNQSVSILATDYFPGLKVENSAYTAQMVGEIKQFLSNAKNARTTAIDVNSLSYLNSTQKSIIKPYIDQIQTKTTASQAKTVTNNLDNAIQTSRTRMTSSETTEVMAISAGLWAVAHFLETGGVDKMYNALARQIYGTARTADLEKVMGCYVDFRSIWGSAVIGFFSGGLTGGWVGATAGSFTAPVIGTVTGAVSGAVAGAAVGFVGGAMSAIATELLLSCFNSREIACRDEGGVWNRNRGICYLR